AITKVIIAVAVYIVSFVFGTEFLKKIPLVKKINGLILSWLVGFGVFVLLAALELAELDVVTISVFICVSIGLNIGYKVPDVKQFIRKALDSNCNYWTKGKTDTDGNSQFQYFVTECGNGKNHSVYHLDSRWKFCPFCGKNIVLNSD
ncbi:MAG: hypothetical protein R3254_05905, partial [Thiomicrorhabdus sp.]|nr:hypothetical protein [Thiomicrorhabdus sp.]